MIDFGMLPPEVNSGRLYAGPGPAPMLGAAAAWDTVAAELGLAATGYGSVIAELTNAAWTGPSAVSMATAAAPYIGWLDAVAMLAEQTAGQARAAAAAYEAAFAMTVPPAVVLENRILLMTLVATNFFGQNSAAIAATEAQYGEMWAQDAAAMYGYLASSSQASTLNAFKAPPETTSTHAAASQAAAGTQTAASQAGNASQTATGTTSQLTTNSFTQLLQQLSTSSLGANTTTGSELPWPLSLLPTPANNWLGLVPANYKTLIQGTQLQYLTTGIANSAVSMVQQLTFGQGTTAGAGGAWYATPEFAHVGLGGQGAAATAGRAVRIGKLSVPHNWAAATVDDNLDELEELELAEIEDLEALENFGPNAPLAGAVGQPAVSLAHATAHGGAAAATSSNAVLGGVPAGLGGGRGGVNYVHKYGWRYSVVARPPAGG